MGVCFGVRQWDISRHLINSDRLISDEMLLVLSHFNILESKNLLGIVSFLKTREKERLGPKIMAQRTISAPLN